MPTKNLERDKATQAMAAGQSRLTGAGRHVELRRRTHRVALMMSSPAHTRPAAAVQVVAGLGCRSGCNVEDLLNLLLHSLQAHGLTVDNLAGLASITHKQSEPGLLALAQRLGLQLSCFSAEELQPYQQGVQGSPLTLAATGSPAVAEPCALALAEHLSGQPARLLGERTRNASATCALASSAPKDLS
ncbi:cobalamin biosynthesis protein [Pseudomonas sp. HMWF032]|uniref:cobalamin biosynthesis protein n=1 Tax=Pseudomonas sp. HMWF032 TaxID=2056866 RepID=UPI002113EDFD|nr:cobalamin biosynthesis protein [Pseudomonas sp. HMWF032]